MDDKCINPNEIEYWQLEAYVDGERTPDVVQHLKHCSACRDETVLLERTNAQLSALLFRLRCPDPEALLNYQWGLLPEKQALVIAAHLSECSHCYTEANRLHPPVLSTSKETTAKDINSVTGIFGQKLRLLVAQLLPGDPMLAPVRSAKSELDSGTRGPASTTDIYAVEELDWDIVLSYLVQSNATYTLQGQLLGVSAEQVNAFKASLVHDDTVIGTVDLNEVGVFEFASLSTGEYTLCFHTEQVKVCIPHIALA